MRQLTLIAALLVAGALVLGWFSGGFDWLAAQAMGMQREFQTALARAVRALKAGEPGAVMGLVALSFGYGVLHAAGPGHGKLLIGGYALANRVPTRRVAAITLAACLAQALMAVAVVYLGVLVFSWTLQHMLGLVDQTMAAIGAAAIGAIGLYLALRGWRMLTAQRMAQVSAEHHHHDHHHDHHHHHACDGHCGHAHAPSPDQIARLVGMRDALMLIGGIAIRPCSGAIFLLILCWRIGADAAGIAAALAMGLGTAVITLAAGLLAATMREGVWAAGLDSAATRRVMGAAGLLVGVALLGGSAMMLRPYF